MVLTKMTGTPAFMAPEVFARSFGRPADMWSLGMLTYQALSNRCTVAPPSFLLLHPPGLATTDATTVGSSAHGLKPRLVLSNDKCVSCLCWPGGCEPPSPQRASKQMQTAVCAVFAGLPCLLVWRV